MSNILNVVLTSGGPIRPKELRSLKFVTPGGPPKSTFFRTFFGTRFWPHFYYFLSILPPPWEPKFHQNPQKGWKIRFFGGSFLRHFILASIFPHFSLCFLFFWHHFSEVILIINSSLFCIEIPLENRFLGHFAEKRETWKSSVLLSKTTLFWYGALCETSHHLKTRRRKIYKKSQLKNIENSWKTWWKNTYFVGRVWRPICCHFCLLFGAFFPQKTPKIWKITLPGPVGKTHYFLIPFFPHFLRIWADFRPKNCRRVYPFWHLFWTWAPKWPFPACRGRFLTYFDQIFSKFITFLVHFATKNLDFPSTFARISQQCPSRFPHTEQTATQTNSHQRYYYY